MACCYSEDCGEYAVTPVLVARCLPSKCCEEVPVCFPCLPNCPKQKIVYCCEKKPKKPSCCEDNDDGEDRPVFCCQKKPRKQPKCCVSLDDGGDCCHPPKCSHDPECCPTCCKPVKTKYVMPCYRYEDGRIVNKLPVTAFKRNGMQDQEHSKLLGTANFLVRHPQDVMIKCDVCTTRVKKMDPAKVPRGEKTALGCCLLKKKPIEINQPTLLMRRACEVAVGMRERRKPFVMSSYKADDSHVEQRYHSEDERGNCCFHFERKKKTPSCCAAPPPLCPQSPCQPCHKVSLPECQYSDCVVARAVAPSGDGCCYFC